MTNIETILNTTKIILCNKKLYDKLDFFKVPHKKISYKIIKDITKLSYEEIGKHFNKSWFAIYQSCKNVNDSYADFYEKILKEVKKRI